MGAEVVMTDVYALDQLQQNIDDNVPAELRQRAAVAHYSWYHHPTKTSPGRKEMKRKA
jgi:hypothetical protein